MSVRADKVTEPCALVHKQSLQASCIIYIERAFSKICMLVKKFIKHTVKWKDAMTQKIFSCMFSIVFAPSVLVNKLDIQFKHQLNWLGSLFSGVVLK